MNRRAFLGSCCLAGLEASAGCLQFDAGDGSGATHAGDQGGSEQDVRPIPADVGAADLPLDDSQLVRGAAKDDIPAVIDPVFDRDWRSVDASLDADEMVIGVASESAARAYPLAILNYHEIVNDAFDGPLLVTYCPLCASGVVAERTVDGESTIFGVSGLLWRSDLVMYDQLTESLWSQILGKAVRGPKTGTTLTLRPSTMTTWGQWTETYPKTEVLLPPPRSGTLGDTVNRTVYPRGIRDYDVNPYGEYVTDENVGIGLNDGVDGRLHPKTTVLGVTDGSVARAYPLPSVREAGGLVNDRVGELPVVVATLSADSLVAYVRRVNGEVLQFQRRDGEFLGGGSTWRFLDGRALDGPHEGATLQQANGQSQLFWFAWADFHPDSAIYG